ncbi:MAG: hypothetical protein M3Q07_28690, partial [Pseudobdellovibrionaceae bacterium]|nr:hypothetical protein [Pseudobdellovibrionaceae bacterium]
MPLKMDRKKLKSWVLNIFVFLMLAYVVEYWQSRNITRGVLPETLRTLSLPTVEGTTRSLWSPEKYTVIYIFAPWCGVCRASGTNIERLPDRFQKAALALSWEHPNEVENFVQDGGLR